jgi:hypothetical protein
VPTTEVRLRQFLYLDLGVHLPVHLTGVGVLLTLSEEVPVLGVVDLGVAVLVAALRLADLCDGRIPCLGTADRVCNSRDYRVGVNAAFTVLGPPDVLKIRVLYTAPELTM